MLKATTNMMFSKNGMAARLKELRGNVSQAEMARQVGMAQQGWARYETGKVLPGAEALHQICVATGVSADWLLGISDDPHTGPTVNAPNNSGAIAIGGGNAVSRDCMECPLLQAHLKRFSKPPA